MGENYIGIFEDKSSIIKPTLSEVLLVHRIKHIFKRIVDENSVRYYYINRKGENTLLKIGKFEVVDIGHGKRNYFEGRDIRIAEEGIEKIHVFKSKIYGPDFIEKELFPMLETLEKTYSWEIFYELQKIPELEKEIKRLEKLIGKYCEEIENLKKTE
jgi:hypothetical protein